jgi:DNA-binding CsgD family transcriptional regulator
MQPVHLANLSRDPAVELSGHYREIIRPLGIEHILTARGQASEREVAFSIARCADGTPFDDDDIETFRMFAESFSSASRLRERIERGTAEPLAPEASRLRRRYALTRRQADVAIEVAKGASVDAVATRLGVGREAVRAHLKAIYRKTETHGRAELVHRLLTTATPEIPAS